MATVLRLDEERQGYADALVREGRFASVEEVVRLGVDLVREQEETALDPLSDADRTAIDEGLAELDAGMGIDAQEVFARLRLRFGTP
jgi:Arc/MetJ-type ribon-helix-helix transcriptional regulator